MKLPKDVHRIKPGTMASILWPDKKYLTITFAKSPKRKRAAGEKEGK